MLLAMCFLTFIAAGRAGSEFAYASKIRKALAMAEIEQDKQAAVMMDLPPAEFSRQMSGVHQLGFQNLLKLPHEFWSAFLPELCAHFGYRVESADLQALLIADLLTKAADVIRLATLPADRQLEPARKRA